VTVAFNRPHGVVSQKLVIFVTTAVRASISTVKIPSEVYRRLLWCTLQHRKAEHAVMGTAEILRKMLM
jgi:hypothetical protein